QIEQLQLAAAVGDRGEPRDQLADSRAIDIVHLAQIQEDLLLVLVDHVAQGVAQRARSFAQRDPSRHVDDADISHLPRVQLYAHESSSWLAAKIYFDTVYLTKVTSIPPRSCRRISNSSMNERIRKIPRPEVRIRFSGASGSGSDSTSKPSPSSLIRTVR